MFGAFRTQAGTPGLLRDEVCVRNKLSGGISYTGQTSPGSFRVEICVRNRLFSDISYTSRAAPGGFRERANKNGIQDSPIPCPVQNSNYIFLLVKTSVISPFTNRRPHPANHEEKYTSANELPAVREKMCIFLNELPAVSEWVGAFFIPPSFPSDTHSRWSRQSPTAGTLHRYNRCT